MSTGLCVTQVDVEREAGWFLGTGIALEISFLKNDVDPSIMSRLDLSGAYVFQSDRTLLFTFGAGGSWVPKRNISRMFSVSSSQKEDDHLRKFMQTIDPHDKYKLRTWYFHVDLEKSRVVRRPTDEEIARLNTKFGSKLGHALKELDERREHCARICPPPGRNYKDNEEESLPFDGTALDFILTSKRFA